MEFFIEIDYKTPSYSVKRAQDDEYIVIYKTFNSNSVVVSDHKDRVYKSSIDKCADLDCTQFYSSAFVSGSVSLCGDCLPRQIVPRVTGKDGCSKGKIIQNFLNSPLPTNLLVTNKDGDGDASTPNSKQFYNAWKASSAENNMIANNTFFIGDKTPCGPDGGCIVSCDSGGVAGCWDTLKFGSSGGGGGTGSFGEVYSINGSNYQVYDPLQIYLAGLIPNGGSFPFLSGNPLQIGTLVSGATSGTCGPPRTCFGCPPGGGGGGTDPGPPNCLEGSSPSGGWSPQPFLTSGSPVVVDGDYTNTIIQAGSQTFDSSRGGAILDSGKFALGGSVAGIPSVSPQSVGITGTADDCGGGQGGGIDDGSGGPECSDLLQGNIYISGAPTNLGGGNWSEGSGSWTNYWSNPDDDGGFRDPQNTDAVSMWGGCDGSLTRANSSWSTPCIPPDTCPAGSGLNTILQVFYDEPGDDGGDCCSSVLLYGASCTEGGITGTTCNPDYDGRLAIGSTSNCPSHSRMIVGSAADGCGAPCDTGGGKCSPPCQVNYGSGKVSNIVQTYKNFSDSIQPGSCGDSDSFRPSPILYVGCAFRGSIRGTVDTCGFPESCGNSLPTSVPAWISTSIVNDLRQAGGGSPGGSGASSDGANGCCGVKMYSPVYKDGWSPLDCGTGSWDWSIIQNTAECSGC